MNFTFLMRVALLAVSPMLAMAANSVQSWVSTELHPNDQQWYANPWPQTAIANRLTVQPALSWTKAISNGDNIIYVDANKQYQSILGLGASLEHATVYAVRKNKSASEQREVLKALIDPIDGIGMNLFRISIGTSDFADGTRAKTKPDNEKGWYSFQDSPNQAFSIERNRQLGIIDTLKMALEQGQKSANPVRFVATPWSPPRWMREDNNMVQGGPLKANMLKQYAQYFRNFIEAYQAEGIPIYGITLQNERQFEPPAYPGMKISWQMERDLIIEVYNNFHNIDGEYGDELAVKIWGLDHNFDYWQQAVTQIDSLKAMDKGHYLDGSAFHHYGGDSSMMEKTHNAHPEKDVIFTEGSVWGIGGDNLNQGFQSVIRHFRHWSTAYLSWVTMLPQKVDEANQGPYNKLGVVGPTMLIQNAGASNSWYKTPEYWLMGQFSRFVKVGARRVHSNSLSTQGMENVAFQNPDGSMILIVSNNTELAQPMVIVQHEEQVTTTIAANSITTFSW